MQFEHVELAPELIQAASDAWQNILESCDATLRPELEATFQSPDLQHQLAKFLACSAFAAEQLRREPRTLLELATEGLLQRSLEGGELAAELHEQLVYLQKCVGAVPSAMDAYLVLRGLRTLHLRMREHMRCGLAVARYLQTHPLVESVLHPGLESHPQHALALRQMRGYSGEWQRRL